MPEQRETRVNTDFVQDDRVKDDVARRVHVPIELLVRSGIQSGSLPTPTLWLGLGARAKVAPYPFHFALTAHVTQSTSATFTNGVGADFRAAALQSRLCLEPLSRPLVAALCAGMQISWIRVSGYAPTDLSEAGYARATTYVINRFIPGPFGSAHLGYELVSRWTVDLGLDVVSPTKRWRFAAEDLGDLYRADVVEFIAYLGLGIRLN